MDSKISIRRQCTLLGLNRSSVYYKPAEESPENKRLIKAIDKLYTAHPSLGSRKITHILRRAPEWRNLNRKRVARLMRLMGISAIYPKPNLSQANPEHVKYPYLLKGVAVERSDQVWCTDITYIPTAKGFAYLVAIMDWHSRYVLSWALSNTLESSFCVKALERAMRLYGKPEIFNSDQGSQFTSTAFTSVLLNAGVRISMDGRGRCMDNIFIERLWRSVKYEEVYTKSYESLPEARKSLKAYFEFYNNGRPHQTHGYKTPSEVYFGSGDGEGEPTQAGAVLLNLAA